MTSAEKPKVKKTFRQRLSLLLKFLAICFVLGVIVAVLSSFPGLRALTYPIFSHHWSSSFGSFSAVYTTDECPNFKVSFNGQTNYVLNVYKTDDVFALLPDKVKPEESRLYKLPFNEMGYSLRDVVDPTKQEKLPAVVASVTGAVHATDSNYFDQNIVLKSPLPAGDYIASVGDSTKNIGSEIARFRVTDLGAIIKVDKEKIVVSAVNIRTRKPWPNADTALIVDKRVNDDDDFLTHVKIASTVNANAYGIAVIPRPSGLSQEDWERQTRIDVRDGDNVAYFGPFRPYGNHYQSTTGIITSEDLYSFESNYIGDYKAFFSGDRPVYRASQLISFKGIVRKCTNKGMINPGLGTELKLRITEPDGQEMKQVYVHTDEFGAFDGHLTATETAKTGTYGFELTYPDGKTENFSITVEQYRKPDFKVDVVPEKAMYERGDKVRFKVKSEYFFGGPLQNAKIKYRVHSYPNASIRTGLREPDKKWSSWRYSYAGGGSEPFNKEGEIHSDNNGEAIVEFEPKLPVVPQKDPWHYDYNDDSFSVSVETTDLSGKTFVAEGSVPMSRGDFALFVDTADGVLAAGEDMKVRVQALDYDKKPVAGKRVKLNLSRWERQPFSANDYRNRPIESSEVTTDAQGLAEFTFKTKGEFQSDTYYVSGETVDDAKRVIGDLATVWVVGSQFNYDIARAYNQQPVALTLDKTSYRSGDKARVVIKAPVKEGETSHVLFTVEGMYLFDYKVVEMKGPVAVVELPIDERYLPNVFVGASLVSPLHTPFTGTAKLSVEPPQAVLEVATDKAVYSPGDTVKYTVTAMKKDGKPVPDFQFCASVVDEGIFAIRADGRDVVASIFSDVSNRVLTRFTFAEQHLAKIPEPVFWDGAGLVYLNPMFYIEGLTRPTGCCDMEAKCAAGNGVPASAPAQARQQAFAPPPSPALKVRSNFADSAAWYPSLFTGAQGNTSFSAKLPDDLTTWRVTVNGITQGLVAGASTKQVVSRKEFMARLALPRFYTEYDESEIRGLIHNQSQSDQAVNVSLQTSSNIQLLSPASATINVAKGSETRHVWKIKVLAPGKAKITLKAIGTTLADAEERSLDVRSFGYRVFLSKNGILKDATQEQIFPINLPADAKLDTANFEVVTSSSSIGPVLGGFESLISYPYGCTEQTLSKLIPSMIAARLSNELDVELSNEMHSKLNDVYTMGVQKLLDYQNKDGGWGWWKDDTSNPYLTSHVLEGLYLLKQAGMHTDETMAERGLQFLSGQVPLLSCKPWSRYDSEDHAKAIYVMSLYKRPLDPLTKAWQLINIEKMSPESLSYLTMAFKNVRDDASADLVYNRLKELANDSLEYLDWDHSKALLSKIGEQGWDYSYRFTGSESTALALRATIAMEPKNEDRLNRISRWLLLKRNEEGWDNTKCTSSVLLALLEKELIQSPNRTTDFVARLSALDKIVKEIVFKKTFAANENRATVPLAPKVPPSIKLSKNGPGWLYYTSMLAYDRPLKPGDGVILKSIPADLKVSRELFKLVPETKEGKQTTYRLEPLADDSVKAGDVIMMQATVNCPIAAPYCIVEAPLPAGGEVLKAAPPLSPGQKLGNQTGENWYWWTHQDVLDDRVAFFSTVLPSNSCVFRTFVRMEMPGTFHINPLNMQAMYTNQIHGRSQAHIIKVTE